MKCCKDVIPNKSLKLIQGDDSNAFGGYIKLKLKTDQDLTGWYLILQIFNFQWRYNDLTSKEIEIVISRDITAQMPVGTTKGAIKLFDQNDLCRTVADVPVYVGKLQVENPEPDPEPEEPEE